MNYRFFLLFLLIIVGAIMAWEFKSGPLDETRASQEELAPAPAYQSMSPAQEAIQPEQTVVIKTLPQEPYQKAIRFSDETDNTRDELNVHVQEETERERLRNQ